MLPRIHEHPCEVRGERIPLIRGDEQVASAHDLIEGRRPHRCQMAAHVVGEMREQ